MTLRRAAAITVVVLAAVACQPAKNEQPGPAPAPPPPGEYCAPVAPTTAAQYQAAFDALFAANTGYWAASDGGTPVPLPDGRVLWLFGDTLVGIRQPNGAINPFIGVANNGFIVQDGRCFEPVIEPIPDPAADQWIWPTGAVVDGNLLRVFGLHMRRTNGAPPFNFELVSVVADTFSLPGLTRQTRAALPQTAPPDPTYGESILRVGPDVYFYGRLPGGLFVSEQYVARAPVAGVLNESMWTYWDGVGWSPDSGDAAPLLFDDDDDPMTPPDPDGPNSTLHIGANAGSITAPYLASGFPLDVIADEEIVTWSALAPEGPFTQVPDVAVVPDMTQCALSSDQQLAYGARVQLDLPTAPVALWSINHASFDAVLADANLYKVCFAAPDPDSIPG